MAATQYFWYAVEDKRVSRERYFAEIKKHFFLFLLLLAMHSFLFDR